MPLLSRNPPMYMYSIYAVPACLKYHPCTTSPVGTKAIANMQEDKHPTPDTRVVSPGITRGGDRLRTSRQLVRLLLVILTFAFNQHLTPLHILDDFRHQTLNEGPIPVRPSSQPYVDSSCQIQICDAYFPTNVTVLVLLPHLG